MRRAFRQPLAVAFALLVVTAAALGGAFAFNDDVQTLDDASNQYVQRGDAVAPIVGAAVIAGVAAGSTVLADHIAQPNTKEEELARADAQETKKELYDQASIQKQNSDLTGQAYRNYLKDTRSIALMTGKKAYIAKLEAGAAESVARNRAKEAVAEYYATKQRNLIAQWGTAVQVGRSAENVAQNTSNVNGNFLSGAVVQNNDGYSGSWGDWGTGTRTVTLLNTETANVSTVQAGTHSNKDPVDFISPVGGTAGGGKLTAFVASPPNDNYEPLTFLDVTELNQLWTEVDQQNTDVQNQLDSFVDTTYSAYQQGDITESELVDPYLGAREYSPESSDTWTLRTLSSMGVNPPENLSSVGFMNVSTGDQTYRGVLMSATTPSGGFQLNQTYNASELTGSQFVALESGGSRDLSGEFTITSATRADGTEITENETIRYTNISYGTQNLSEFKALQTQLDNLTAQINARQQRIRNSGGVGWLPDLGGLDLGSVAPVVVIAGGALVLLGRN